MAESLILGDIISVLYLLVAIIGLSTKHYKNDSSRALNKVCIASMTGAASEAFCRGVMGKSVPDIMVLTGYMVYYSMGTVTLLLFIYYCYTLILEKTKINKLLYVVPAVLLLADFAFILVKAHMGQILIIENGEAILTGGMPKVALVVQLLLILYMPVIALTKYREIGWKPVFLMGTFGILPIIAAVLSMLGAPDFSYVAGSLSVMIVYVLLENNFVAEKEQEHSRQLSEYTDIISRVGLGVWHLLLKENEKPRMQADEKLREIMGIDPQELSEEEMYLFWWERIVPEDMEIVHKSFEELQTAGYKEITYRWEHPTKGIIYNRSGATFLMLSDGTKLFRGYHSDVTEIVLEEQKQKAALSDALDAAQHASRAKTVFLNNMSHDIRTPMNAIIGFTALAGSHIHDEQAVMEYLKKISISGQHLLELINDVLDMSRIESGKVKLEEKDVHLPDVLHDLKTIVQSSVTDKKLEFYIDTQDVIHEDIIADRLRLNQVLLNVISNAIKFTPSGGMVSVRIIEKPYQNNSYADYEFRIKDSGIGMDEEFQKHIFEAFSRERTSTVSGIQGTGLGMAITRNIVDMMGGEISLTSQISKGTEFVIRLHLKLSEQVVEYSTPTQLLGMRVLVVDGDLNTCTSVTGMLSKIGMRGEWTASGKEALFRTRHALEQGDEFKAYIIDYLMPDMNGIAIVREIRKLIGESKPIIILTTYDWVDIEKEAREAGVTAFCSKPLFMSELREILSEPFLEKEEKKEEKIDFSGKRLLLVEDNELNREIAVTILEEAGFTMDTAEDGVEAVEKIKNASGDQYDLILMDIQMPIMDGYEATRQIRALEDKDKAGITILAMTANAFEEDKEKALAAGMNGHLSKPIDVQLLMSELQKRLFKEKEK